MLQLDIRMGVPKSVMRLTTVIFDTEAGLSFIPKVLFSSTSRADAKTFRTSLRSADDMPCLVNAVVRLQVDKARNVVSPMFGNAPVSDTDALLRTA